MSSALEARGLAWPGRLAATDLALEAGSLTFLLGPNGSGKTTLLHALAGIGAAEGEVRFEGAPRFAGPGVRRLRQLTLLPATRDAHWPIAALDYVALGWPGGDAPERARATLASLEAEAFVARPIDRLSTGERARVMLARALIAEPAVLLLDEPIANLDPKWRLAILDRLRREAGRGAALLVSAHDLDSALDCADRVVVMHRGRIVADGPPSLALKPQMLAEVFGVARRGDRWVRA